MDTRKLLKAIIDERYKGEALKVGNYDNCVAVTLMRHTVMVLIPENEFFLDENKLMAKGDTKLGEQFLEKMFNTDKSWVQVFPTPITKETAGGICRVFEGGGVTTLLETKRLALLWDNKGKNTSTTFYIKGDKSPVVVKFGDRVLGCICPVYNTGGGK